MTGSKLTVATLSCGLLLAGCASTPQHSDDLVAAQNAVNAAKTDQRVLDFAPTQLQAAQRDLAKAEDLANERHADVLVSHYAYLATREAEAATTMGETGAVKQAIDGADKERDQVRLQAREREA